MRELIDDRVISALDAAVTSGPAHAYIFAGPSGADKRGAATYFARAILCGTGDEGSAGQASLAVDPEFSGPCGECNTCRRISAGIHPDVITFEPEGSFYLVDQVRSEIVPQSVLSPAEAGHRILVLDEAERLNVASANALLKTLEEPVGDVTFVLIASPDERVLPETIRSRCQLVRFDIPTPGAIREAVGGGERAVEIARVSAGRLDRARRLADDPLTDEVRTSLLSIPRRLGTPVAAIDAAAEIRDLIDRQVGATKRAQEAEADALKNSFARASDAKGALDRLGERHHRELRRARADYLNEALDILESWYRDVALVAAGGDSDLLFNPSWEREIRADAEALGFPSTEHMRLAEARAALERNPREDLWLEALLIDLGRARRREAIAAGRPYQS